MNKILLLILAFVTFFLSVPIAKADTASGTTFSITKVAAPTTVAPGSTLAYSVTIRNISQTNAAPQIVTDTLPQGFSYVGNARLTTVSGSQVTFTPTVSGQLLTWTFDGDTLQSIPANQNIVISYQVSASSTTGTYPNQACIVQPENVCAVANVTVAVNPNTSLESNVILGILIGCILIVIALSIPKTKKSFEEKILSQTS